MNNNCDKFTVDHCILSPCSCMLRSNRQCTIGNAHHCLEQRFPFAEEPGVPRFIFVTPSYTRKCGILLPLKVGARSPPSLALLCSAASLALASHQTAREAVQVLTSWTKTQERACMVAFHAPSHSCTCCSTYELQNLTAIRVRRSGVNNKVAFGR